MKKLVFTVTSVMSVVSATSFAAEHSEVKFGMSVEQVNKICKFISPSKSSVVSLVQEQPCAYKDTIALAYFYKNKLISFLIAIGITNEKGLLSPADFNKCLSVFEFLENKYGEGIETLTFRNQRRWYRFKEPNVFIGIEDSKGCFLMYSLDSEWEKARLEEEKESKDKVKDLF